MSEGLASAIGLPEDWRKCVCLGRIETADGPSQLLIRDGLAYDMTGIAPTVAALIESQTVETDGGQRLGEIDPTALLSPIDLHCVKAADVTFAVSALERVIEERTPPEGSSAMDEINRDPEELVRQAMSEHDYPDGFALFLGTLFAPSEDRGEPGRGFTHKPGDVVTISTPRMGRLVNRVTTSKAAAPWTAGIGALTRNLAARGLLGTGTMR